MAANEIKLFGKWAYEGVTVGDLSVEDFIALKPKDHVSRRPDVTCFLRDPPTPTCCHWQVFVPHTAGRYQIKRFRKAQCPIVERLVNSLMRKGRNNGKKTLGVRIVQQAFEIIHLLTDENPLQVRAWCCSNAGSWGKGLTCAANLGRRCTLRPWSTRARAKTARVSVPAVLCGGRPSTWPPSDASTRPSI